MKIKLLIAAADSDYAEHLSNTLSEKYADTFEVSVCRSAERMQDLLLTNSYDSALLEQSFIPALKPDSVRLPLLLIDESGVAGQSGLRQIRKYQRISNIAGNVLENYAEVDKGTGGFHDNKAHITAVWSPSGGSGKTTIALAFAAHESSKGKQTVYLNFENFSSTSVYFQEDGKSISKVFEKLESNVNMLLTGIRRQDSGSGILYFCGPENYDDINILTASDVETLVDGCAAGTHEVVVDLSSQCCERVRKVFDMASTILIVCDNTSTSQVKLRQFINQHNVFRQIESKVILVNNKGAKPEGTGISRTIQFPLVQTGNPVSVFKALSGGNFDR